MVRFHIPNMHGSGCVRAVTAALRCVDGDAEVQGTADTAALAQALRAVGFEGQRLTA